MSIKARVSNNTEVDRYSKLLASKEMRDRELRLIYGEKCAIAFRGIIVLLDYYYFLVL